MTSQVNSIFDIVGALKQGEVDGILPKGRIWQTGSENTIEQGLFLNYMLQISRFVPELVKEGLMKGKSSWNVKVINQWFKQNNFSIELTAQPGPGQDMFYVGSIYSHLLKWLVPGTEQVLRGRNQKMYEGVYMKRRGVKFFGSGSLSVVEIATENPADLVYLMPCDFGQTQTPFDLLMLAKNVQAGMKEHWDYSAVHFPMVDLDITNDISWIEGLWTPTKKDEIACVAEAKQQCKLKLNHKAAKAESATGMSISLEATSIATPMKIDRPFLFWISRKGIPVPLFAAHVDYSDWKNPGEIS